MVNKNANLGSFEAIDFISSDKKGQYTGKHQAYFVKVRGWVYEAGRFEAPRVVKFFINHHLMLKLSHDRNQSLARY